MTLAKYEDCISGINLQESALILGNGASISLSKQFNYKNLYEEAKKKKYIDKKSQHLFKSFETTNFEEILYKLQICKTVNKAILVDPAENIISRYYADIKEALIQIVGTVHPEPYDIFNSFPIDDAGEHNQKDMAEFLCQFKYVINLNYDLLVYYILLSRNSEFADGFGHKHSDDPLRFCENFISGKTQLFYPHGNLTLAIDDMGEEFKIKRREEATSLLSTIMGEWKSDKLHYPLFVCEGESNKKKEAILKNSYLSYVYRSILPSLPQNIICYGWSVGENDQHILQQILKSTESKHLFISIYDKDKDKEPTTIDSECDAIEGRIHRVNHSVNVDFFSSMDDGCWSKYRTHDDSSVVF